MKKWLILFLFLLFAGTTSAETYYVDAVDGNDAYDGNSVKPWKTIPYTWSAPRGGKTIAEGDTVLFRNGNYGQFQESTNNGSSYLFYRTNWITYKAAPGHSPNLTNIDIMNNDKWGGAGIGQSYLKFEGFNVTGINSTDFYGTIAIVSTEYMQIKDCNIEQYPSPYSGAYAPYFRAGFYNVYIGGINADWPKSRYITIDGCTVHNGYRGIFVDSFSSDIIITNNTVYHIGEDGIDTLADNSLLGNNLIYNIHAYRVPINFMGTITGSFALGNVVTLNSNPVASGIVCQETLPYVTIWSTSAQSFFNGAPSATSLRGTIITGPSGTLTNINYADGAHCDGITVGGSGITCSGAVVTGNKILRNLPGDEGFELGVQCLKLDGPQHITVSNNLLVTSIGSIGENTVQVALLMGGGVSDCNLVNNTMFGSMDVRNLAPGPTLDINNMFNNVISSLVIDNDGACKPHIVSHGNNIFGNNPDNTGGPTYPFVVNGTELKSQTLSSGYFTNYSGNDFTLLSNSLAKNFGSATYQPSTDILGIVRNASHHSAGAYEYPWSPVGGHKILFRKSLTTYYTVVGDPNLNPDCTGNYFYVGHDKYGWLYYKNPIGFFLWKEVDDIWIISPVLYDEFGVAWGNNQGILGDYLPGGYVTGIATVSGPFTGYK
jgi:hypothetical protein